VDVFHTPVDSKIFFAGEALPLVEGYWGFANGAAYSGKGAAKLLICLDEETEDCGSILSRGRRLNFSSGQKTTVGVTMVTAALLMASEFIHFI
jgi:hypothetical protein